MKSWLVRAERKGAQLAKICRSSSGMGWNEEIRCDSKDCPVFYSRTRRQAALANEEAQLLPILENLVRKEQEALSW